MEQKRKKEREKERKMQRKYIDSYKMREKEKTTYNIMSMQRDKKKRICRCKETKRIIIL